VFFVVVVVVVFGFFCSGIVMSSHFSLSIDSNVFLKVIGAEMLICLPRGFKKESLRVSPVF